MDFGGLIHHLIHRQGEEVAEHDVDDRAHAGHRGAYPYTRETGFGDGRVDYPVRAKFFYET
jgi:hypothetical protein